LQDPSRINVDDWTKRDVKLVDISEREKRKYLTDIIYDLKQKNTDKKVRDVYCGISEFNKSCWPISNTVKTRRVA